MPALYGGPKRSARRATLAAMTDDHARISPTAHVTAWTWHRMGMPHAALFATRGGWLGFWSFRLLLEWWPRLITGAPSLASCLAYRHRLIEAAALGHQPDLLIEIAGGLSRRGVTFAADHGVRTVEIDLPHMVAAKAAILDASPLKGRLGLHRLEAIDVLSDGFADELRRVLGDSERPVVVMEGLLGYFSMDQRAQLLGALARALAGREALVLADIYTVEARAQMGIATTMLRLAIRGVTRGQGTRGSWADLAAVEAAWKEAGFASLRPIVPDGFPVAARPALSADRAPLLVVQARP